MGAITYTHRRSAWLGSMQWLPAPAFNWNPIEVFVVHWPGHDGAWDGDPGESADRLDDFIRNAHNQYMHREPEGYNIGYNIAGDWLGGTWELRGDEFKCAANAGLNDIAISYIVFCDLDGRITPQAIAAVQRTFAQARAIKPGIRLIGHGQGPALYPARRPTATACPGGLQQYVNDGTFAASPIGPLPPNEPGPTTGTYTVVAGDGWFAIGRKLGVEVGPLLAVNGATLQTIIHPGQVLKIPGVAVQPGSPTDWVSKGMSFSSPDGEPLMERGKIHPDTMWLQAVLCSMPGPDGTPLYNPEWVGDDSTNNGTVRNGQQYYGDATFNSVKFWQGHNGLVADGKFGPKSSARMVQVRGK
jgi:LysM repeat protein